MAGTPERHPLVSDVPDATSGHPVAAGADPLRVIAWPAGGANPYMTLLYDGMRAQHAVVEGFSPRAVLRAPCDVWHIHWPEHVPAPPSLPRALWRCAAVLVLMTVARLRGIRIVWTAHNLGGHESAHPRLERWFLSAFTQRVTGFIALTASGRDAVQTRFPALAGRPSAVVAHGHYRGVYPDTVSRESARTSLGIPEHARVVALVGQLRAYKNVPHLVRVFRRLARPDVRLVIAGKCHPETHEREIREAAAGDARVIFAPGFVEPEHVQLYFRASDLVVLPFRDVLNSGSALLALSFDAPLLVARRGAMVELERGVGADWVRSFEGELTTAILDDALAWACERPRGPCSALDALDWSALARETIGALRAFARLPEPVGAYALRAPHDSTTLAPR